MKVIKEEVEFLRNKLEKLISGTGNLVDSEVISVSQELDKLISQYYLREIEI